jgi:hypothetical protein
MFVVPTLAPHFFAVLVQEVGDDLVVEALHARAADLEINARKFALRNRFAAYS